jgi:hypothetical protein
VLVALAAFPYGPLFAWSPVHPGYVKLTFKRAGVLYPADRPPDPAFLDVDRYVALAESFHNLNCPKRITVISCRDWNDCLCFAGVFLGKQRPVGVTIATGTVIFLTPYIYDVRIRVQVRTGKLPCRFGQYLWNGSPTRGEKISGRLTLRQFCARRPYGFNAVVSLDSV